MSLRACFSARLILAEFSCEVPPATRSSTGLGAACSRTLDARELKSTKS